MILGLSIAIGLIAAGIGFWWLSLRFQVGPVESATQWPEAPSARPDFAGELAAIGVETGVQPAPNYRSGEYPVVAVVAEDPVPVPTEPVEHVARHAADRALESARPWLTPAVDNESTPFFWATGELPTYDVDQLSATNSWNRAALRERLGMDTEEAA